MSRSIINWNNQVKKQHFQCGTEIISAVETLSINGGIAAMWEFMQLIDGGKDTYLIPIVEHAMKRLKVKLSRIEE